MSKKLKHITIFCNEKEDAEKQIDGIWEYAQLQNLIVVSLNLLTVFDAIEQSDRMYRVEALFCTPEEKQKFLEMKTGGEFDDIPF